MSIQPFSHPKVLTAGIIAATLAAASPAAAQSLSVYASAPGVTTAENSGLSGSFLTENFNGFAIQPDLPAGVLTTSAGNGGTYTIAPAGTPGFNRGPVSIDGESFTNPDFPGGYGGLGQGNYLAINGTGSVVKISFTEGQSYFGFYASAVDSTNQITFFGQNNQVLGQYSSAALQAILQQASGSGLTAENGTVYPAGQYYGQTAASDDFNSTEPYAYLHFIDPLNSQSIYRVEMTRAVPATGEPDGFFESDNHSVAQQAPDIANTPLVTLYSAPVPEPGAAALALLAAAATGLRRRR